MDESLCLYPSTSGKVEGGPRRGWRKGRQGLGLIPLLVAPPQEGPQWLHVRDFDRLLRESQREVLRLQRQIALRNQQEPPPPTRPPGSVGPVVPVRAGAPTPGAPGEVSAAQGQDSLPAPTWGARPRDTPAG